jgi:4-amino-4-deoxy-L-arabinose transferase-like glycosyltransferase
MQWKTRLQAIRGWDFPLIGVAVLAALVRCFRIGLYTITWDEVNLLFWSMRIARYGDWIWLSNNWSSIPGLSHSPISNYLLAIPYLFTLDPRVVRLFVALLGVLAVILAYLLVNRFFDRTAATFTGLLFAVSPMLVQWSREVWNPNLAPAFIALWALAGLVGYHEGKRWGRLVSWVSLSIAVQAHPGNVLLGIPALYLVGVGWFNPDIDRRDLIWSTLAGIGLAVISLVPWVIGLAFPDIPQAPIMATTAGDAPPPSLREIYANAPGFSLSNLINSFSEVSSGTAYWPVWRAYSGPGNWWPPKWTDNILWVSTWLALAGAVGFLVYGFRKGREGVPYTFLGLVSLWPLFGYALSPIRIVNYYVMAIAFGSLPIQGILLSKAAKHKPWGTLVGGGLLAAFLVIQTWSILATFRWLDIDGWKYEPYRAPLRDLRNLIADWTADGDHEVLVILDGEVPKYATSDGQTYFWTVIGGGYPVRIVSRFFGQGVPVSPDGATVVAYYSHPTIPALFGEGEPVGLLDGKPIFRQVDIPPGYALDYNFTPENISRFNNGARMIGLYAPNDPQAGQPWPVILVWEMTGEGTGESWQFSLRLADDQERRFGQSDFNAIRPETWRDGDIVFSETTLWVGEDYPDDVHPRIEILMYTSEDNRNADATDDEGNVVAPWLYLSMLQ